MTLEVGGHRLVLVIAVVAVLCLVPAAHGSPPDPTWVLGFYDNADFDDVVLMIAGILGVVERSPESSLRPPRPVDRVVLPTGSDTRPLSLLSSALGRAPPTTRDDRG
jgi:hypothetical protein